MKKFTSSSFKTAIILFLTAWAISPANAQTLTLLSPTGDGGFETGTTFAANGWSTAQPGAARQWQVGNAGGVQAGARTAYVGSTTANNGNAAGGVMHFYRDIAIPANAVNVLLSFYLKEPTTDNGYDYFYVFTTSTANTPISGTIPGTGYVQRYVNTATAYTAFTAIPSIDLSALAGTTVRLVFTYKSDGVTPVANPAVDNISLTYAVGNACTGTPGVASITSSSTGACANAPFTLNATNLPPVGTTGVTYQWQSRPAGSGAFTDITGATTVPYTVTGQSAATDYQLVVICTNTGLSSTSAFVTVAQNAATSCYCIPSGNTAAYYIDNFATTGGNTNITNNASGFSTGGYGNFTAQSASATQGTSINFTSSFVGNTFGFAIFIDYNQDGDFADPGENVFVTSAYAANASGSFTIPYSATMGNTRMRIVAHELNPAPSAFACGTNIPAEFEDYTFNVLPATPCSGTPLIPVVSASTTSACLNAPFTLNATNISPAGVSGVTYQWQSSVAGSVFADIPGATTVPYTVAGGQSVATDYRLTTTCTNSSQTSLSAPVSIGMNSYLNCYCTASHTTGCNSFGTPYGTVNTVSFGTINSTPGCSASPYYTNVPQATTSITPGNTYTLTINSGGYDVAGAWFDWNEDGIFSASEYYALGTSNSTATATNKSASITVPAGAVIGTTRMRIRTEYYGNTFNSSSACGALGYGQTLDYTINIATAVPCSGTPPITTVATSATNACTGNTFSLSATGIPAGITGLTYQWQYRIGTGIFNDLPGATTNPYTATLQGGNTDFQLVLTCTNGGLTTASSNFVTVTQNAPTSCYCIPTYTTGCTSQDDINTFTLVGDNSTSFNQTATGCSTNAYADYTALTPVSLMQGGIYNGTINSEYTSTESARIWIDFNDDGLFASTESVGTISSFGTTLVNYTITLPVTGNTGTHRMRVRLVYATTAGTIDPCNSYTYGETHDYLVNVTVAPPCVAPTVQPTNLVLTAGATNISGTYTAAVPAVSGYLVVQTANSSPLNTNPTDGIVYNTTTNATIGNGTVVYAGTATSFNNTGLVTNSMFTYSVIPYNNTACTGGPLYFGAGAISASATTQNTTTFTGAGNWSDASHWSGNTVPSSCSDAAIIASGANCTLDISAQAASVTVNSMGILNIQNNSLVTCKNVTNNGTIIMSSGSLTVGNTANNNTFANTATGTLTVSGGTLTINGNFSNIAASTFAQTGGAIIVDGNAGGVIANSVVSGTPIVNFASSNLTLSDGTFTIVDPSAATTLTSALDYNTTSGNVEASVNHTFIFGDGVSTDPGGNTGMRFRPKAGTGRLNLGTVIVNGGAGLNRLVYQGTGPGGINGSLTINNGGEYRLNSALFINGNLIVNTGGIFTTQANAVTFSGYTAGVAAGATVAQTITNNGTIQNLAISPTANFAGITVQNAFGLTMNSDMSYSGILNFTAASSSPSILKMANGSKLVQITGGTVGTASATAGWINGRFQKVAAAGTLNNAYAIGDATTYAPITIAGTGTNAATAVLTAGNVVASTVPGEHPLINTAKINQDKNVNRIWKLEENGGVTFNASSVQITPTWAAADVDPGANTANFIVGRYDTWVYPTVNTPAATSIKALNDNNGGANTIFGDYIVGEPAAKPSITADLYGDIITSGSNTGAMRTDLQDYYANNNIALLPTTDPYGTGATYTGINNAAGPAGQVVDWIKVEVWNPATPAPASAVESRSLLLKPNGAIVDMRGLAPAFSIRTGNMRLVLRHRNHLAIMSNNVLMNDAFPYNFTTALSQASNLFGDPAQMVFTGGKWCMWAGDVNGDLGIDGTDAGQVSGAVSAGAFDVYIPTDLNMDGGLDGTDAGVISFSNNVAPFSTLINY